MKKGLFTLLWLIITVLPALAATDTSGPWGINVNPGAFTSFSTAKRSPVTLNKTMVLTKITNVNTMTVTARDINIRRGGGFNIAAGQVLTIPRPDAGRYQIFYGTGTVVLTGADDAYLEWWGATGGGLHNDSPAVQLAVYSLYRGLLQSTWYSKDTSPVLSFANTKYALNDTVLTNGRIQFKGNGTKIVSTLSNAPVFDTAYWVGGALTSNVGLSDADAVTNELTNLQFEGLSFDDVDWAIRLRASGWQSHVRDCSFYYGGRAIEATLAFYTNFTDIMSYGTKSSAWDTTPKIDIKRAANRITLENVSVANFTSAPGTDTGIGISIGETGQGSGAITLIGVSAEVGGTGILLNGEISSFTATGSYFEQIFDAFKDSDGAIKNGVHIGSSSNYAVGNYVNMSGLRNSTIDAVTDQHLPLYQSVVNLYAGTNGNQATVFVDNSVTYNAARYTVSAGVVLMGLPVNTTPVILRGSTAEGTCTYVSNVCTFEKKGDIVYFSISVEYTGHTGTGGLIIDVPYPVSSTGLVSGTIAAHTGYTLPDSTTFIPTGEPGQPVIYVGQITNAGVPMGAVPIASAGTISIFGSYQSVNP